MNNPSLNGGSNFILGRGQSPGMVEAPNLGSLAVNGMLNGGYQSLSASTSPIMPPTPGGKKIKEIERLKLNSNSPMVPFLSDDLGDSVHNMPVMLGNSVGSMTGSGSGNFSHPRSTNVKVTPMQIRCKFGQLGPSKGQFNSPHGFCLGTDEDIIVADTNNHRIQVHHPRRTSLEIFNA